MEQNKLSDKLSKLFIDYNEIKDYYVKKNNGDNDVNFNETIKSLSKIKESVEKLRNTTLDIEKNINEYNNNKIGDKTSASINEYIGKIRVDIIDKFEKIYKLPAPVIQNL